MPNPKTRTTKTKTTRASKKKRELATVGDIVAGLAAVEKWVRSLRKNLEHLDPLQPVKRPSFPLPTGLGPLARSC